MKCMFFWIFFCCRIREKAGDLWLDFLFFVIIKVRQILQRLVYFGELVLLLLSVSYQNVYIGKGHACLCVTLINATDKGE